MSIRAGDIVTLHCDLNANWEAGDKAVVESMTGRGKARTLYVVHKESGATMNNIATFFFVEGQQHDA